MVPIQTQVERWRSIISAQQRVSEWINLADTSLGQHPEDDTGEGAWGPGLRDSTCQEFRLNLQGAESYRHSCPVEGHRRQQNPVVKAGFRKYSAHCHPPTPPTPPPTV